MVTVTSKSPLDVQYKNQWGRATAAPIELDSNSLGAVEVGAFTRTKAGLAFTVALVERSTGGRRLDAEDFSMATVNDNGQLQAGKPFVVVRFADGRVGTSLEGQKNDAADRTDALMVTTRPGATVERPNGDRVVQHFIVLHDLPESITQAEQVGAAAAHSEPVVADIEISVHWTQMGLIAHAEIGLSYSPQVAHELAQGRQQSPLSL